VTIKREDIKKLVIQQMLQESIQEEGAVSDWLRQKASSGLIGGGKAIQRAGEKIAPKDASKDGQKPLDFNKKLQLVADFIQMNRDSKVVKDSDLGKMLFSANPLQEAYESQLLKLMKDKKIDEKDVDLFLSQMSKNEQARKQLQDLGLIGLAQQQTKPETDVSDDMIVGSTPAEKQPEPQQIAPDLVPGMEVKTKKAKINFLPPIEDAPTPEAAKEVAKTSADRAAQLKQKFDSGKASANEKDELLALMGIGKQKTVKRRTMKKQPAKKVTTAPLQKGMTKAGGRLGESLREALVEEIYNLLTGKTK
jgi:hypothetical protein